MTSRVAGCLLQASGVMVAQRRYDLVGGDAASRIRLHRVIDRDHFVAQPALDRGVALLQRA